MGLNYYYGTNGVEKNLEKAYHIFKKLGDDGDMDACVQLGCMHFLGHYVEPSAAEAKYWWEMANEHDEALYGLGMIHHQGAPEEGIAHDSEKAIEYWEKASDMFNEAATAALYKYYKNRPSKEEKVINVHNHTTQNIIDSEELNALKIEVEMLQETVNYEQTSTKQKLEELNLAVEALKKQPAPAEKKVPTSSPQFTSQINNLTVQLQNQENTFNTHIDKLNALLKQSEEVRIENETKHQQELAQLKSQLDQSTKDKSEQTSRLDALAALVEKLGKAQEEDKRFFVSRLDTEINNFNTKLSAVVVAPSDNASKEPSSMQAILDLNLKLEEVQKQHQEVQKQHLEAQKRHQEEREQLQAKVGNFAGLIEKLTAQLAASQDQAKKTEEIASTISDQLSKVKDMGTCKISHQQMTVIDDMASDSNLVSRSSSSTNLNVSSTNLLAADKPTLSRSPSQTSKSPKRTLARQQTRLNVGLRGKKRAKKNLKAYMDLMIKVRKRMIKKGAKGKSEKELLLDVFKTFDKDGGGTIDALELKNGLATLGVSLSLKDVEELMLEVDEDGSGEIDYKELVDYLTNTDNKGVSVVSEEEPPKEPEKDLSGAVNVARVAGKFKKGLKK